MGLRQRMHLESRLHPVNSKDKSQEPKGEALIRRLVAVFEVMIVTLETVAVEMKISSGSQEVSKLLPNAESAAKGTNTTELIMPTIC